MAPLGCNIIVAPCNIIVAPSAVLVCRGDVDLVVEKLPLQPARVLMAALLEATCARLRSCGVHGC